MESLSIIMLASELRRDKVVGLVLIILGVVVLPIYLLLAFYPTEFLTFLGLPTDGSTGIETRVYAALIPVVIGVTFLLLAGTWVGLSMITTRLSNENQKVDKKAEHSSDEPT